jgi:hypothetical protein
VARHLKTLAIVGQVQPVGDEGWLDNLSRLV